jgi:hypothetical protein
MRFHSLFFLFPLLALITLAAPHDAHADISTGLVNSIDFGILNRNWGETS